ncbi:hypothetical protein XENOCAPTIV_018669 [Xenoophorus captivus]|uniref:Uncharacterized protein n=1 Tax=Xenoophorus captivus TaxID=1517983 RepID=A0ABV0SG39_9TELE
MLSKQLKYSIMKFLWFKFSWDTRESADMCQLYKIERSTRIPFPHLLLPTVIVQLTATKCFCRKQEKRNLLFNNISVEDEGAPPIIVLKLKLSTYNLNFC